MSEKSLSLILVLIMFLLIFPSCISAQNEECDYVALGDSISTGYGLENKEDGFVSIVASQMGYRLCNYAQNGWRSEDVKNFVEGGTVDGGLKSAEFITLTVGGNDLMNVLYEQIAARYNESTNADPIAASDVIGILQDSSDSRRIKLAARAMSILSGNGSDEVPFAESEVFIEALGVFSQNLCDTVSYIREINPDVRIVVATQYNPYKGFGGLLSSLASGIEKGAEKLNNTIIEASKDGGFEIADVYNAFEKSEDDLSNADSASLNLDFHPNKEGHAVIAECFVSLLSGEENSETKVWKNPYSDVSENDWFYDAVKYVSRNKLFAGVDETRFAPHMPLSRAMLATVIYRAEGEPEVNGECGFEDVEKGSYYEKAVIWAEENGIVKGVSPTEFMPRNDVTREQIAAIMLRYADYKGEGPVGAWAIRLDYSDIADISDYAAEGVMFCTMKGIMNGRDSNRFAPADKATRAEFAKILYFFKSGGK